MTDFLLIRHGETDWNRALRFQGQVDVPLNAMGQTQAQRLGLRVAQALAAWRDAGRVPTRVISSDLVRAQQTAQPIAEALGQPCDLLPDLREQSFGVFEGLRVPEIKERHPDAWQRWLAFDANYAVTDAESTQAFHDRVVTCLHALAQQHAGEQLVVVTHGGVLDMVWRHAQALSLHGPRVCDIPNAGWNQVAAHNQSLHIQLWADTAHLVDLPPQPVYRQAQLKV